MSEYRDNAVIHPCRWCGRTDTLRNLPTGKLLPHNTIKGGGGRRCWGSKKKVERPALSAPEHPRSGFNPVKANAVTDVVEVTPEPPTPPSTIDTSHSVRAVSSGLPTLGRGRR